MCTMILMSILVELVGAGNVVCTFRTKWIPRTEPYMLANRIIYEYLKIFAGGISNPKLLLLSHDWLLGLHSSLQYFLVFLNDEALFLDNLTQRLWSLRDFVNLFRLFHTVILYFHLVLSHNTTDFVKYRIIFFLC